MKAIGSFFFGLFCLIVAAVIFGLLKATLWLASAFWSLFFIVMIALFIGTCIKDVFSGRQ